MLTKSDIKLIKSLNGKEARTESGLFVVEGEKLAREAIRSGMVIRRVFITEKSGTGNWPGRLAEVISNKEMERISLLKTPSQALALLEIPKYDFSTDIFSDKLVLALDNIQDPGNLGTIIRVADWFGIRDIICSPDTADCFNPKAVQATMGALLRVRIHYREIAPTLAEARMRDIEIYGTFLQGEVIYDAELSHSGVIVMGNEGRGVSLEVAGCVTRKLFIPSYPADNHGSESLNVAAATAIICSEFRRRR